LLTPLPDLLSYFEDFFLTETGKNILKVWINPLIYKRGAITGLREVETMTSGGFDTKTIFMVHPPSLTKLL
jgi:hypothetical protein